MSISSKVHTTNWTIDPAHSEIHFKVKHLMLSTVTGFFNEFEGEVVSVEEDFENAKITFSADTNSLDTKNKQRDEHLKSNDFFNAEKFPKLTFQSTSFCKKSNGLYRLIGNLTIRDCTKEVELSAEFNGTSVDLYGQTKAGFEIKGKINRKDFGLRWNALTENGGFMISDEVRMIINIQLIKR
jgi:polyisoprenoid-binding protein YceI